jgi:hypothetical protein
VKTQAERLAIIERKIEDAARELNPLLAHRSRNVVARRTHDALNALAAARLEVGLLQQDTENTDTEGATP